MNSNNNDFIVQQINAMIKRHVEVANQENNDCEQNTSYADHWYEEHRELEYMNSSFND